MTDERRATFESTRFKWKGDEGYFIHDNYDQELPYCFDVVSVKTGERMTFVFENFHDEGDLRERYASTGRSHYTIYA